MKYQFAFNYISTVGKMSAQEPQNLPLTINVPQICFFGALLCLHGANVIFSPRWAKRTGRYVKAAMKNGTPTIAEVNTYFKF